MLQGSSSQQGGGGRRAAPLLLQQTMAVCDSVTVGVFALSADGTKLFQPRNSATLACIETRHTDASARTPGLVHCMKAPLSLHFVPHRSSFLQQRLPPVTVTVNRQHASQECQHLHSFLHLPIHTHTRTHDALPALWVIVFGTWPLSPLLCNHTLSLFPSALA